MTDVLKPRILLALVLAVAFGLACGLGIARAQGADLRDAPHHLTPEAQARFPPNLF